MKSEPATELRKTGISVVGDMPWGTHLCHFYETKEDLLEILIPYFKTGLENDELWIWVVADPLGQDLTCGMNMPVNPRFLNSTKRCCCQAIKN